MPEIVVYGTACPACTQAKEILRRHNLPFQVRALGQLCRSNERIRSIPQITIDGDLIGGLDALLSVARSGALRRMAAHEDARWVEIRRRVGRGYDVVERDRLGRETNRVRVPDLAAAEHLADTIRSQGVAPRPSP